MSLHQLPCQFENSVSRPTSELTGRRELRPLRRIKLDANPLPPLRFNDLFAHALVSIAFKCLFYSFPHQRWSRRRIEALEMFQNAAVLGNYKSLWNDGASLNSFNQWLNQRPIVPYTFVVDLLYAQVVLDAFYIVIFVVAKPRTTTPRDLYSRFILDSCGISSRHGPHQVAHIFISTTLFEKSESLNDLPSTVFNVVWRTVSDKTGAESTDDGAAVCEYAEVAPAITSRAIRIM